VGLRKRFKDFRDWCPQPPDRLPTKLKHYAMPIAAVAMVTLVLSMSFFVLSSSVVAPILPLANGDSTSTSDWPMFNANPSHTGVGTGSQILTPKLLWTYNTFAPVVSSPAVVDGVVYIGSDNSDVIALNATSGVQIWNYSITPVFPVYSSPAVDNGVVYVGSMNSNVYALNATNGAQIWSYNTRGPVASSPAVVGGVVYIGSGGGISYIYALNATNGAKLWSYPTSGYIIMSSPAVVGGDVYIGSTKGLTQTHGSVYALNATAGTLLWNYTTNGRVTSSPTVANGVVYVGDADGNVYALDAANGGKLWNYSAGGAVEMSPAVADGWVYAGGSNSMYALNATNGSKLWNYTANLLGVSPAFIGGVVYVGNMTALNATDGVEIWSYDTDKYGSTTASSPAVVNGVIYVGGGYRVYALGNRPAPSTSFLSSNASLVLVGVLVAIVVIVASVVFLFRKRLKTRLPPSLLQNFSSVRQSKFFKENLACKDHRRANYEFA